MTDLLQYHPRSDPVRLTIPPQNKLLPHSMEVGSTHLLYIAESIGDFFQ